MPALLLDTNVVSAMRRLDKADAGFLRWLSEQSLDDFYISSLTLLELRDGVLRKTTHDRAQGEVLLAWYQAIRQEFIMRTLAFSAEAGGIAADIRQGRTRKYADVLIAATALAARIPVVTHDSADFHDIEGLTVIDPW